MFVELSGVLALASTTRLCTNPVGGLWSSARRDNILRKSGCRARRMASSSVGSASSGPATCRKSYSIEDNTGFGQVVHPVGEMLDELSTVAAASGGSLRHRRCTGDAHRSRRP
jgi:hypothetical protein